MCVVCDMKKAVSSASPEVRKAVMSITESLANGLADAVKVARRAESRLSASNALSQDEEEQLTNAEAALRIEEERNPLADLLSGLLGGITVTTINVDIEEGESLSDAIARTLKDNEESSAAFTTQTKH